MRMRFDETELIEFFGVLPEPQGAGEKEFFGAPRFEVADGRFRLSISFSPLHEPKVMADLTDAEGGEPVLHIAIRDTVAVRPDKAAGKLVVLAAQGDDQGADPGLMEKLAVHLHPLKLEVRA